MGKSKLLTKKHLGANIYRFRLTRPFTQNYQAGEFIQMTIKHDNPDDRGESRWFTLTSITSDAFIEITTRYYGDNSSTFKKALMKLKSSDVIHISDPMGDFVLPKNKNLKLLFVAAGIGITPFLAILKSIHENNLQREIKLLWKLNNKQEILNLDGLIKRTDYQIILNSDNISFGSDLIFNSATSNNADRIYISGAEPMVEQFGNELFKLGYPKSHIYSDFFPGYIN